ncbi:MAG: homoserine O-succinyltransferase [Oscillospiraceae bacterium]|jgi:homoserine O-succinyltransferase|nr:homoserine O-succinyltransferase [Oscillospiraceae bacterium]
MPIKIKSDLPAHKILESENIFTITETRALTQDIRPLEILILNLMPTKIQTETQLLRLLGNSPLQVNVELLQTASHCSKNTESEHLDTFYKCLDDIKHRKFDGMIITGAPVEHLRYEDVDYWQELTEIFDWAHKNVYSIFNICWGAQASLYYNYGIPNHTLQKKLSGVYRHHSLNRHHPLLRGLNDTFHIPHSRHTTVFADEIAKNKNLEILAVADNLGDAGIAVVANKNGREFYSFGHFEYDRLTLAQEYFRDIDRGLNPDIPQNYFPKDNPKLMPQLKWRTSAMLIFTNWLNYYVYQQTPYDIKDIANIGEN